MGRLPAEVRAMTPDETVLLTQGWNEAQAEAYGQVQAPTDDEFQALLDRYG